MHTDPNAPAGFTLLELLIALTLFSVTLLLVYNGLYAAGRGWQASEHQARAAADARLLFAFLRRQIGQATPILQIGKQESRALFQGDISSLQFVSELPAHHAGHGLHFLKLAQERDELTLRYTPVARDKNLFEDELFADAKTLVLAKDVREVEFAYFGRKQTSARPGWHTHWDEKKQLPELVRFQVTRHEQWPELLIALRSRFAGGRPHLTLNMEEKRP